MRNPRWWLTVLVATVLVAVAWEGIGALLGDGDFTPREAAHNFEIGLLGLVISPFLISRMRS